MPLEIRLLHDSEYKAINDFYNKTNNINRKAPEKQRTYEEFCWEFVNCPNGKAIYCGAWETENGKEPVLAGILCGIIFKMQTNAGEELLTIKGESVLIDFNVSLRHRKTDILKELFDLLIAEARNRGAELLWGFNTVPASYKRLGFENPFKSIHGVIVLNPFRAYRHIVSLKEKNSLAGKVKTFILAVLAYLYSLKRIFISGKHNYPFNTELNENSHLFRNAAADEKLIFLVQDQAFLNWRITENPYPFRYKSYQFFDQGQCVAQVICSIKEDLAFIEQTLFDDSLPEKKILSLLKFVLQSVQKEKAGIVRFTGFANTKLNRRETELLKKTGLLLTGKGEWFTCKNLTGNPLISPEKIYFSRMYKQGVN